jgi:hypothetical protein
MDRGRIKLQAIGIYTNIRALVWRNLVDRMPIFIPFNEIWLVVEWPAVEIPLATRIICGVPG